MLALMRRAISEVERGSSEATRRASMTEVRSMDEAEIRRGRAEIKRKEGSLVSLVSNFSLQGGNKAFRQSRPCSFSALERSANHKKLTFLPKTPHGSEEKSDY